MPNFHSLKVHEIRRETADAVSIVFDIPEKIKNLYAFTPGQYVTIEIQCEGEIIRRSYSICSAPSESNIRVAVKSIPNGVFSNYANTELNVGTYLDVSEPEGRFTLQTYKSNQNNYIAFVAGSGITPLFSMIKDVLEKEPNSTFFLIYNNKSAEQTIFKDEIHALELKYTGRFIVHFIFSQVKDDQHLFGRIDKSTVHYIIRDKYSELDFSHYFICGPEKMIDTVYNALIENNIQEKQIKFELFTASAKETEIETTSSPIEITVLVDDEETTFEMSSKLTILDAALKEGLDVPYSCQGGICSSCMCQITEGSATMKKNSILDEDEIASGLILACQAIPTSAKIAVDFDDV